MYLPAPHRPAPIEEGQRRARGPAILDIQGERLVASITVEAVDELALTAGSQVTAVVKASDVILATD